MSKKAKAKSASKKPTKPIAPTIPADAAPRGVPTGYSAELGFDIAEAVAHNMSVVSWCKGHSHEDRPLIAQIEHAAEGEPRDKLQKQLDKRRKARADKRPSFRTVMRWQNEHENFLVLMTQAGQHRADFQFEELVEIADNTGIDTRDRQLMVSTRQWTASRMNRTKYGDRVDLVAPGDTANADQKRAELAALLGKAAGAHFLGEGVKLLEKLGVKVSISKT